MFHLQRAVCRAHRREQAEHGFPLLRGCPNTFAISLVAYLDHLEEPQRRTFADQLSDFIDADEPAPGMTVEQKSVLLRELPLVEAFFGGRLTGQLKHRRPDVRFIPVKVLAGVFRDQQVGGFEGWATMVGLDDAARAPAEAHAASLDEIVPVAPRRLRRLIKGAMADRFSATEQRLSSEHIRYDAQRPGGRVLVDILFARSRGGSIHQLDYFFAAAMDDGRRITSQPYEALWGCPGRWDYITEANAERSIAHFVRLTETWAGLT